MPHVIEPIGIIRSPYKSKDQCPIQGVADPDAIGTVDIRADLEPALHTIETFSHLYLIYLFDRAGEIRLQRPTFLDSAPHGIFASRHPCRPNSIGLSIVRLLRRSGCSLTVSGIDVLDNTPLIDIKPYVPRFDARPDASNGWVGQEPIGEKPKGRE